MPADATTPPEAPPTAWYSYAVIRVVPRVERGECVNVGVIIFARTMEFLQARIELNEERLRVLDSELDLALLGRHLQTFLTICAGAPEGGPLAALPPSERFHWLTSPRSTIIQTSPVHVGSTPNPAAELESLLDSFVRTPR